MSRVQAMAAALVVLSGVLFGFSLSNTALGAPPRGGAAARQDAAPAEKEKANGQQPATEEPKGRTLVEAAEARGLPLPRTDFEHVLRQHIIVNFDNIALSDVVTYFADQFDINLMLDAKGLADAAVDSSAPVTCALRKPITFEAALHLILDEFELTFVVQNEVIKITSKEKADSVLTTKVYPVGDLLNIRGKSGQWGPLIQMITSTVQPDTWDDNGGAASIQPFSANMSLVICQTREVHIEIGELLAKLREAMPKQAEVDKAAAPKTTNAVYRVGAATGQQVAEAIKKMVAPTTWSGQGGEGQMFVVSSAMVPAGGTGAPASDILLVRQSDDVQDEIQYLVATMGLLGERMAGKGMWGGSGINAGKSPANAPPNQEAPPAGQAAPAPAASAPDVAAPAGAAKSGPGGLF